MYTALPARIMAASRATYCAIKSRGRSLISANYVMVSRDPKGCKGVSRDTRFPQGLFLGYQMNRCSLYYPPTFIRCSLGGQLHQCISLYGPGSGWDYSSGIWRVLGRTRARVPPKSAAAKAPRGHPEPDREPDRLLSRRRSIDVPWLGHGAAGMGQPRAVPESL